MKSYTLSICTLAILAGLSTPTSTFAGEASSDRVKFSFPVGFTFANGAYDVQSELEESLRLNGFFVTDDFVWPVGLSLNPRVDFPFGLGLGAAIGPTEFIIIERRRGFFADDSDFNYILPVGGYLQYTFLREKTISPFVRAGARYPITGGEFIKSGTLGPFVAGGVEFFRAKKVGLGIEAGYDWSEVKVGAGPVGGDRKVRPIGFNASLFVRF